MDAGRRTMSALKTSEGGKSSRPDGCSTQCGAQCGALLYPFDRSSASTDESAARSGAMQGRARQRFTGVVAAPPRTPLGLDAPDPSKGCFNIGLLARPWPEPYKAWPPAWQPHGSPARQTLE